MKWYGVGLLTCAAMGCWVMAFIAAVGLDAGAKMKAAPEVTMRGIGASGSPFAEQPREEMTKEPPSRAVAAPAAIQAMGGREARPNREPEGASEDVSAVPAKAIEEKAVGQAGARAAVPMGGEGILNLIASDSAEVLLDGTRIGPSPKRGIRLAAGSYKVRFDCYDEGELKAGAEQTVQVVAGKETHVDYDCPTANE